VLGIQVNLVLGAVKTEPDCTLSFTAIDVIDEQSLYLLRHLNAPFSLMDLASQSR
jgi:hypothetical protein